MTADETRGVVLTFDEWLALNTRLPSKDWTFKQYGNYLDGWRNSMPWAYKGMSVAYDRWAEKRWDDLLSLPNPKEWAIMAWKMGLQSNHERLMRGENLLTVEESADGILSIPAFVRLGTDIILQPQHNTEGVIGLMMRVFSGR